MPSAQALAWLAKAESKFQAADLLHPRFPDAVAILDAAAAEMALRSVARMSGLGHPKKVPLTSFAGWVSGSSLMPGLPDLVPGIERLHFHEGQARTIQSRNALEQALEGEDLARSHAATRDLMTLVRWAMTPEGRARWARALIDDARANLPQGENRQGIMYGARIALKTGLQAGLMLCDLEKASDPAVIWDHLHPGGEAARARVLFQRIHDADLRTVEGAQSFRDDIRSVLQGIDRLVAAREPQPEPEPERQPEPEDDTPSPC